jgi:hypothetical protein
MLQNFVGYVKAAMLLTFGDWDVKQKQVMALRDEQDIYDLFEIHSRSETLIFIIDQINALEPSENVNPSSNKTKDHVRLWLEKFASLHHRIRGASANHETFHHMRAEQTNDIKISAQGGFSKVFNQNYRVPY